MQEIDYLNELKNDYAGFVIGVPKSKRNLKLENAIELKNNLSKDIKSVAVCVSPSYGMSEQIRDAGFDVLQIHGDFDGKILDIKKLKLWRAVNILSDVSLIKLNQNILNKIEGIVVDALKPGSGKTFSWDDVSRDSIHMPDKKLILAGGLSIENVSRGIEIFDPDIVDVSSSLEDEQGKNYNKIKAFIKEVRGNG